MLGLTIKHSLYNSILPKEIVEKLPYIDKTTFILSGTFTGVFIICLTIYEDVC